VIAAAAGVLVVLVVAVVLLLVSNQQVRQAQAETAKAYQGEAEQRLRAEANQELAEQAVEDMYTQVAMNWLSRQPGMTSVQRDFLLKALQFYQQFAERNSADPVLAHKTAKAYVRVGDIHKTLGEREKANAVYEFAVPLFERLVVDFPDQPLYRYQLAVCHNQRGIVLRQLDRLEDAEQAHRQALELKERLTTEFPNQPNYRADLGSSFNNLGTVLKGLGRPADAEAAYLKAVELLETVAAEAPAKAIYTRDLAMHLGNLAEFLSEAKRPREAEPLFLRAVGLHEKLLAAAPDHPAYRENLAICQYNRGNLLAREKDRKPEAVEVYRQAEALLEKLTAEYPLVWRFRPLLAKTCNNLGSMLMDLDRDADAKKSFRRALELKEQLVAKFSEQASYRHDVCVTLYNLALLARRGRELSTAADLAEQVARRERQALDSEPRNARYLDYLRKSCWLRAEVLLQMRQHAEAAAVAEEMPVPAPDGWLEYFQAAGVLGRCMPLAQGDDRLPEPQRAEVARRYGDRALEMLRQAQAKGFRGADQLKTDTRFRSLQARDDFQLLLTELRARSGPP
jgi:tetratricopeptide (TPR) repeat protein